MLGGILAIVCGRSIKFCTVWRVFQHLRRPLHADLIGNITFFILRLVLKLAPRWNVLLHHFELLIFFDAMRRIVGVISGLYEIGVIMSLLWIVRHAFLLLVSQIIRLVVMIIRGFSLKWQRLGRTCVLPFLRKILPQVQISHTHL